MRDSEFEFLGTRKRGCARAGHSLNSKRFDHFEKSSDFVLVSRHLDYQCLMCDIDDVGAKDFTDLDDLRAGGVVDPYFHQYQFPGYKLALIEVFDFKDIDQFVELLDALIKLLGIAFDGGRNTGVAIGVRGSDIECINVESTSAEHPGHTRENAELIFDEDGYGVSHDYLGRNFQFAKRAKLCATGLNGKQNQVDNTCKFAMEMPLSKAPVMPRNPWSVPARYRLAISVRPSWTLSGEP